MNEGMPEDTNHQAADSATNADMPVFEYTEDQIREMDEQRKAAEAAKAAQPADQLLTGERKVGMFTKPDGTVVKAGISGDGAKVTRIIHGSNERAIDAYARMERQQGLPEGSLTGLRPAEVATKATGKGWLTRFLHRS